MASRISCPRGFFLTNTLKSVHLSQIDLLQFNAPLQANLPDGKDGLDYLDRIIQINQPSGGKDMKLRMLLVFLLVIMATTAFATELRAFKTTDNYTVQEIIKGLYWPTALAIDRQTDQVYFVQRHAYDDLDLYGRDPAGLHENWERHGDAEAIYLLKDGKPEYYRSGAGDPWGSIQDTNIFCDSAGGMYIYCRTYIDEEFSYLKIDTRKRVYDVDNIYVKVPSKDPYYFGDMVYDRFNKQLYIYNRTSQSIDRWTEARKIETWLDRSTKEFPDGSTEYQYFEGNITADLKGNLYTVMGKYKNGAQTYNLVKISADKTITKIETEDVVKKYGKDASLFLANNVISDSYMAWDTVTNRLITHGYMGADISTEKTNWWDAIYATDIVKGKVELIAKICGFQFGCIRTDSRGNIWVVLYHFGTEAVDTLDGRILKISPKK